jgi:RimJ/RimL family protein N-acetyltransferase
MTFGEIMTPRLVLRPPAEPDFADMLSLWSDADLLRHIGRPSTREEIWARLLKYVGHWALFGFGYRIIREAASGRFVGEAGIAYQRRANSLDDPEAGWALVASAQGRGFASEALDAILAQADGDLDMARTTCLIAPDNLASTRLAERHGYRLIGAVDLAGSSIERFERLRPSVTIGPD